jgi:glyceraldehyde-3-phosphate dehydrogenase/erythrose-4-phosphate dehydrogenase
MTNIVHVVGTGTIGEPLIGLLADHAEAFGIDEVTFHKRTPMIEERAKVRDLTSRGATLAVDADRRASFEELGHAPKYETVEAIERATVVIDCTPAGNANKDDFYGKARGPKGFLAQGSEFGFGKPYARGINDEALLPGDDRFVQVVSCNTHNISVLIKTLAFDEDGESHLENGRFLCIRRSNDISQEGGFVASPVVGRHDEARFGTHHARDAHELFQTLEVDLRLFSSSMKLNTQYMHALHFSLALDRPTTVDEAIERLAANPRVALTYKRSANQVFSFGRDHGYYGRILSQTVVPVDTLAVREGTELVGFCFTPQDGNALLSSVAATLWYLHPDGFGDRLEVLRRYLFREV